MNKILLAKTAENHALRIFTGKRYHRFADCTGHPVDEVMFLDYVTDNNGTFGYYRSNRDIFGFRIENWDPRYDWTSSYGPIGYSNGYKDYVISGVNLRHIKNR